jgi:hypothetical protein
MRTAPAPENLVSKDKPSILHTSTHRFQTRHTPPQPRFAVCPLRPPLVFHSPSVTPAPSHPGGELLPGRCGVRGCIYPADPTGMCLDHQRQTKEPRFFQSHQPTLLVMDQARFGVPDSEPNDVRTDDRRQLAAARAAFLEEAA